MTKSHPLKANYERTIFHVHDGGAVLGDGAFRTVGSATLEDNDTGDGKLHVHSGLFAILSESCDFLRHGTLWWEREETWFARLLSDERSRVLLSSGPLVSWQLISSIWAFPILPIIYMRLGFYLKISFPIFFFLIFHHYPFSNLFIPFYFSNHFLVFHLCHLFYFSLIKSVSFIMNSV